jgi:lysophospholipase L1-like esterase
MAHVIVFGDSISYGLFDEAGGWVHRVRAQVDRRNIAKNEYWTLVYNLGVSGDTAADLMQRIETELPARKDSDPSQDNIVIFALGINDSTYLVKEDRRRFTIEQFRSNLHSLVRIAKSHANKIGLLGLFLVDQSVVDPIPWAPEMAYRNALIREFNSVVRDLCNVEGCNFIDLLPLWPEGEAKQYLQDGVHPNSEGHKRISAKVLEYFQELGIV